MSDLHREPRQVGFRTFLLEPTPSCVKRATVQSSPFFPSRHNAPGKTQKTNGSRNPSGIASQSEGIQAALNSLLSHGMKTIVLLLLLTIIMKGVFSTWLSRGRESLCRTSPVISSKAR
jgi:hypothetical protein